MKTKTIFLILGNILLLLGLQGNFNACAKPPQGGEATFIVTANVRGQIDPCG